MMDKRKLYPKSARAATKTRAPSAFASASASAHFDAVSPVVSMPSKPRCYHDPIEMLKVRQLVPPVAIHTPDGRSVSSWDFKQKKNLVIAFLHSDCEECRGFLQALSANASELAEHGAVVLAAFLDVPPRSLRDTIAAAILLGTDASGRGVRAFLGDDAASGNGLTQLGVFVTDRYGELKSQWITRAHSFPATSQILGALWQAEIACEECGEPHWPV
jgi:peroxiredoxin